VSLNAALDKMEAAWRAMIEPIRPFRGTIVSLSGGMVTILREDADSADTQLYARAAGWAFAVNDVVLCLKIGGQPFVLCKIQNSAAGSLALDAGLIGEVIQTQVSQDAADNPSTTATSTYQVLCTGSITLPAGTWALRVALDARATHGTGGNISLKINVGGTASSTTWTGGSLSAARTLAAQTAAPGSWVGMSTGIAGISGGGAVNVFGGYISSGGNTATTNGPRLLIDATRTA
jgi:hypothetical protein